MMLRPRTAPLRIQKVLHRLGLSGGGSSWDSLYSLADQAVVSGVTFLVTVLLGRWCGADELGAYALGFTIVVFVIAAQMAIISIPYTNQWRRLPEGEQKDFAGCALLQQLLFAGLVAGTIAVIAVTLWLFGFRERFNSVLLALSAVLPLYLIREFTRRHAFAHLRMRTAVILDASVATVQISGLVCLFLSDGLTAVTAFAAMGLGAGLGGATALILGRRSFSFRLGMLRRAMNAHWKYGRWVLAAVTAGVLQGYVMHWLLALIAGTTATGIFAACMTVVLVVNPIMQGVGNVLEPKAAKAFAQGGHAALRKLIGRVSLAIAALMLLFCTAVALFGGRLVTVLYAGSEYAGHGHLVFALALYAVASAIDLAPSNGLRAMDRPDMSFRAACLSLLITISAGVLLVSAYGLLGAAYAMFAGAACGMVIRITAFMQLSAPQKMNAASLDRIGGVNVLPQVNE